MYKISKCDELISKIKKVTDEESFKKKVLFFRHNPYTKRENLYEFFLNNDDLFYYYVEDNSEICIGENFNNYYCYNRSFDSLFEKWLQHIDETYDSENKESLNCVIV